MAISPNPPRLAPVTNDNSEYAQKWTKSQFELNETPTDVTRFRRLVGNPRRETNQNFRDWMLCTVCTLSSFVAYVAYMAHSLNWSKWDLGYGRYSAIPLIFPALIVSCCRQQNLYRRLPSEDFLEDTYSLGKAVALAALLLIGFHYLSDQQNMPRKLLALVTIVNFSFLLLGRYLSNRAYTAKVEQGRAGTHVLIVGSGEVGCAIVENIESNRHLGYVFKGFLDHNGDHPMTLGTIKDLPRIARDHFVDEIFITISPKDPLAKQAIVRARELCLDVTVVPELFEDLGVQAPLEYLGNIPLMELHREPIPVFGLFIKRTIDVIVSAVALTILFPVITILALLIYLDSPGPIFYTSERVGKKGRTFGFHKLRSMVAHADSLKDSLQEFNERDGVMFKMSNDPRVTRLGRFMRKYSLDELPQVWNVLMGEMSLVGPRPPLVAEYLAYRPEHRRRLDVVPGITGLWQVSGRKDPSFEGYVSLDLKYIENWDLLLDFKILIKTIPAVLRGTGY